MHAIAVAALSARQLAQAAARAGLEVVALDAFGDRDTCAAASRWVPIGASGALRIDAARLLDALRSLARSGAVQGWVVGSGFEACPELLEQGAALLPLLGTAGADVRRVRDPKTFFDTLDALGIAHPEVRLDSAGLGEGWLIKDFGACGASHIRHAGDAPDRSPIFSLSGTRQPKAGAFRVPESGLCSLSLRERAGVRVYAQREAAGTPMSATFIGNGRRALLLGCNRQIVRPFDGGPYRFHGVIGPLAVPAPVRREIARMLDALTAAFALRGLGSLDFLLDGHTVRVLEVNPRPPASLALYPRVGDQPVFRAHLAACAADGDSDFPDNPWRTGAARDAAAASAAAAADAAADADADVDVDADTISAAEQPVRGTEIIFAPRPVRLSATAAAQLATLPATHDLPRDASPGSHATHFAPGEPLCSVSASGADLASVSAELARRRDAVLDILQVPETVE